MAYYGIAIDIGHLLPTGGPITERDFPHLAYAVRRIAEQGQSMWQAYASGAPLPNGKTINSRSGAYMRSIMLRTLGTFAEEIYSDLPYAIVLERGAPAIDMKKILNSSLKVRISKKGKRYLIIPFRHGTPGAVGFTSVMTQEIVDIWKGLKSSSVTGMRSRASGTGAYDIRTRNPYLVDQRMYRWGDRVTEDQLRAAGARGRQIKRMTGMVHMQNQSGGSKHGQYLTFRVMLEGSPGWIRPAMAGYWPAKTTATFLKPVAEKAFNEAVKRDVSRIAGIA